MRIDILTTDPEHPVVPSLRRWIAARQFNHTLRLIHHRSELSEGDILYLVSCSQIIGREDRALYSHVMVLHASDLPIGRGWSPHIWDLLAGHEELTVSLLTAEDGVDTGAIWDKLRFTVPRHTLYEEINSLLFRAELELLDRGIEMVERGKFPVPQATHGGSYHSRRRPEDSRIDPALPLTELFDKIRVADPDRFPAFFEMRGKTYEIILKKRKD